MDKRDSCTWRGCKQDAASPHPKGEKVLHPRQLSNLERLPPEIIEFICTELLDGESVINLRNSSSQCRRLVDLALLGKIGSTFWLKRTLSDGSRAMAVKALESFRIIVEENQRREDGKGEIQDLEPELKSDNWEGVFKALFNFRRLCAEQPLRVKRLTKVQNEIKNEVAISFKRPSRNYPRRMEGTCGSLLFHIQVPCSSITDQQHLYVYEDMKTYRRGLQVLEGMEKVTSVHMMTLPIGGSPSEFPDSKLPSVTTLCIVTSAEFITLAPLHQGIPMRISVELPLHHQNVRKMPTENRFAVWGNYIAAWVNPDLLRIYRVTIDPSTGDVSLTLVRFIDCTQLLDQIWDDIAKNPENHVAALRQNFNHPFTFRVDGPVPVFSILSPIRTSATFNFGEVVPDDPDAEFVETEAIIEFFEPKINCERVFSSVLADLGTFIGHKSIHNVVFFWTRNFLVVLFSKDIWIYQCLSNDLFQGNQNEELIYVESQSETFYILGSNLYIYMVLISFKPPKRFLCRRQIHWGRGTMEFEVIRKIKLVSIVPDPRLELKVLHFDFDKGKPYIFLALDLPRNDRTAFTFELVKVEFVEADEVLHEEMDEKLCHLKQEDTFSAQMVATEFPVVPSEILSEGSTGTRLNTLLKLFGIPTS